MSKSMVAIKGDTCFVTQGSYAGQPVSLTCESKGGKITREFAVGTGVAAMRRDEAQAKLEGPQRICIDTARTQYPGIEWRYLVGVASESFTMGDSIHMLFSLHPMTRKPTLVAL